MPQTNPYPWPKIANVAAAASFRVNGIIHSFDQAADLIATAWKHRRGRLHQDPIEASTLWLNTFRRFQSLREAGHIQTTTGFHDYFARLPCVATQKYDGTNVGVTEDGMMLGRRQVLPVDAVSYQSTPLDEVKAALATIGAVKAAVLSEVGLTQAEQDRCHCTIYGELMCNKRRFDYSERGLGCAFACFGMMFRGAHEAPGINFSALLSKKLAVAGFEVAGSEAAEGAEETFQIKCMMCPKLRGVFTAHGLRVVAAAVRAPMVEVVRHLRSWMMDGEGEGVVLTIGSTSGDRGGLVKWKTATESQGSAPEVLSSAVDKLKAKGQHPPAPVAVTVASGVSTASGVLQQVQLVDPEVVELLVTMHDVATSDCKGRSHTAVTARKQQKKSEKQTKPKLPAPVGDEEIRAAYESALTKFDSLEGWFTSGATVTSVSQTLFEELAEDLGCLSEDAKGGKKKKPKAKAADSVASSGGSDTEHCEFERGTVRSFRKCGCTKCDKQLAKQQFVKAFVMRNVGSAFGAWKVRAAGGGGM